LWLAILGCEKYEVGETCTKGQSACEDVHLGLFCSAGHFATMSCGGPAGCQKLGKDDVACDNPVAKVGDGCNQENDAACTEDRAQSLVCKREKFVVVLPCKGPRGCRNLGDTVHCDDTVADPGDRCALAGNSACNTDRSAFMKCKNGKFEIASHCRGPKRCTVTEKPDENREQFECDDSITESGDPCEDEGEQSCSSDKRSVDVCKAHKIVVGKRCEGSALCAYDAASSHFDCGSKR